MSDKLIITVISKSLLLKHQTINIAKLVVKQLSFTLQLFEYFIS